MDSFEESVRRALQAPHGREHVDADDFLADVHRGARGRRTRHLVGGVVASAAVVSAGGYLAMSADIFPDSGGQVAAQRSVVTTLDAPGSSLEVATSSSAASVAESRQPPASPRTALVGPPSSVSTGATGSTTASSAATEPAATTQPSASGASTAGATQAQALSLAATGEQQQWVLLAAADKSCPQNQCAVVEVTKNGGRSWEPLSAIEVGVSPEDQADPAEDTVRELRFADDGTNGWTFGGELLSTHDAGVSWTAPSLPVPGAVTSLEAWGDSVYAIISDETQATVALVRSPVDYDEWQVVSLETDAAELSTLVTSERIVALLARPTVGDVASLALVSTDGVSWEAQQPCEGASLPSTLSTTDTSLWALCTDGTTTTARVSRDDGQTWSDVPGEFSVGSQLAARDDSTAAVADSAHEGITLIGVGREPTEVSDADLVDVGLAGFTNPTTGYVLDAEGEVSRTDDGGRTWRPYSLPR